MMLFESAIRELGPSIISPFYPDRVQPASYDLELYYDVSSRWVLPALTRCLAATCEAVKIPSNLAAEVRVRSTAARLGLIMPPTLIDPGFEGIITVELFNSSHTALGLTRNGFAQIIFFRGEGETSGYDGRYQNQKGITEARPPKEINHGI